MKLTQYRLSAVLLLAGPAAASAAIMTQDLGTAAPPAALGGQTLTAFNADGRALFSSVSGLTSPLGGTLGFSPNLEHRRVALDGGWGSWSHSYAGDVYRDAGSTATLTLPTGTTAFYLYLEPDNGTQSFTVSSGGASMTQSIFWNSVARGFGFYATGGDTLSSISITTSGAFAVGEFGIAAVPEPGQVAAGLVVLGGVAGYVWHRRRPREANA